MTAAVEVTAFGAELEGGAKLDLIPLDMHHLGPLSEAIEKNRDHIGSRVGLSEWLETGIGLAGFIRFAEEDGQTGGSFHWVLTLESAIAGQVSLVPLGGAADNWEIAIWTDRFMSRRGIASAAGASVAAFAYQKANAAAVFLRTTADNIPAQALGEKLGRKSRKRHDGFLCYLLDRPPEPF